jgi:hypothetical protein
MSMAVACSPGWASSSVPATATTAPANESTATLTAAVASAARSPRPSGLGNAAGRTLPHLASTATAAQAMPTTMRPAPIVSLGRCQLAVTVATPTPAANRAETATARPRTRYGTTSASPHIRAIAVVVCPLGKLLSSRR